MTEIIGLEAAPVAPDAPARPAIVCTLGMHRSGTSVVSRLLNLLGVNLGPDDAMSPLVHYNARGLWEHRALAVLNDEILAAFGGSWDVPPALPAGWTDDPRLEAITARARRIVDEQFSDQPIWGWKDPRTCLTLPFWHRALGPMRHVVCLRNPGAVVASLARRDCMPAEQAEALWLAHVRAALAHTSGRPRLFVFYEDVIDDWPRELRRLARFVGDPDRADDPRVRAAARDFVDTGLCHHHVTVSELACDPCVSAMTIGLFVALRSLAAERADAAGFPDDERARQRAGEAMNALADRAVREWTAHAESRAAATAHLERAATHASLHEIRTSVAWTLVTRARAVIERLLPAGTRRRTAFHTIVRRLVLGPGTGAPPPPA